jgi:hypothetical protein
VGISWNGSSASSIRGERLVLGHGVNANLSYQKSFTNIQGIKGWWSCINNYNVCELLTNLLLRSNKPCEAKSKCESALRIYEK